MTKSKIILIGFALVVTALVGGAYTALLLSDRTPQSAQPALAEGAVARLYASTLNDANDKPTALAQWKGKTLVINFWAPWCPPCREEMPAFSRLQTKHAANGVQFVGIALDSVDNVRNFSQEHPATYPLLVGGEAGSELASQLGNSQLALPYTLILAPNGDLRFTRLGRVSEQELDTLLQQDAVR